jgi:phytoene/squalene synthetase
MSRDTSFYYSFLVLPPRKRQAIVAVWDFCRAVDDAVDEVVPEAEWQGGLTEEARSRAAGQLCLWRAELEACYLGAPTTSQGRALDGPELERLTGFDEGPMVADWAAQFEARGIRVTQDVGRADALAVYAEYGASKSLVYNARGASHPR